MSPVDNLREVINGRLAAAAAEIFAEFKKTISQYEEEISLQRRLLDDSRTSAQKLQQHIKAPQQGLCKVEEGVSEQHLCDKERDSSQDLEETGPPQVEGELEELDHPQMKEEEVEEEEELCTSYEEEQLQLNQEDMNQYKEEMGHQLRFLDVSSGSKVKLHCTGPFQLPGCKEEDGEHLISEDRSFTLDPQGPGQLAPKPDTDAFLEALSSNDSHLSESKSAIDQFLLNYPSEEGRRYQGESQLQHSSAPNLEASSPSEETPSCMTDEKPYSYDSCGQRFSELALMAYHERMLAAENHYTCKACGKHFKRRHNLTRHLRTHTGEKPYSCEICGEDFSNSWSLTVHRRTHTGEKPYTCKVCGKGFNQSSSLTDHTRTHTGEKPYSCKLCGKCFGFSSNLLCHMRTHTGEKPYCCKVCGKCFSQSNSLVCHTRTHTGEKPYSCKVCGRCFTISSQLYSHMKTHRGEIF